MSSVHTTRCKAVFFFFFPTAFIFSRRAEYVAGMAFVYLIRRATHFNMAALQAPVVIKMCCLFLLLVCQLL